MAKHAPTGTPALVALTRAGVPHTVHPYEHDPSTPAGYGLEAAHALGLPPEQVFKTLLAEVDGRLVVAVVPVTTITPPKSATPIATLVALTFVTTWCLSPAETSGPAIVPPANGIGAT